MNERIVELLAKTSAYGPGGDSMDRYNCSLSDLEKFAQLIVRECMTNLYLNGYDDAVMQIKQHFGVEE
jgi:hypothetical protein